jgi:hypothetical protein
MRIILHSYLFFIYIEDRRIAFINANGSLARVACGFGEDAASGRAASSLSIFWVRFHRFPIVSRLMVCGIITMITSIMAERNLLLMRTGYDIAFPRIRRADPQRILWVKDHFPGLR